MATLYNPGEYEKHPDPAGMTTCCEDNAGEVGANGSVLSGNGPPVSTPTGAAIYYQLDSIPPNVVWTWNGSAWQ
jgi:hypothetical protein